jgi:hypothetical protein
MKQQKDWQSYKNNITGPVHFEGISVHVLVSWSCFRLRMVNLRILKSK